jgi:site-specific DNA recombinase
LKFPVNVGEAAIVNQVFDLYAKQRLGVVSVARWLNENGYRNRNCNLWRPNAVHGILTNRVYVGEVLWKDRTYEGKHAPIVDTDTFERAQQFLEVRGKVFVASAQQHN